MSRISEFLETLSDRELAYFAKYKLHTYMKETQLEIKKYLDEKNFDEEKINRFLSNDNNFAKGDLNSCPRCGSNKIRKDDVEWTATAFNRGYSDEFATMEGMAGKKSIKQNVICNVCGYWLSDPNHEKGQSIWNKILNFLFDRPFIL